MHTRTQVALAIVAALGLAASNAFASTDSSRSGPASWQNQLEAASPLAKKGRGGGDDLIEHPTCDDRGDDLACVLAAKGRGKGGTKTEDNGVDPPDACDDHGDDLACVVAAGSVGKLAGQSARAELILSKRSKPRVPGGSGCDDPRDLIEHPECLV